jgi:hypothetical protein
MKKKITIILALCFIALNSMSQIYHEEDKEGLREFLRQSAYHVGHKNFHRFDMEASDTTGWLSEEAWVNYIRGLTWNQETPKRIISIAWSSYELSGDLNCNKWPALTYLDCYHNMIKTLDVSACLDLEYLNCEGSWLKTLDLNVNAALEYLNCNYGGDPEFSWQPVWHKLDSLKISGCTSLKELYCTEHNLTSLVVINFLDLEVLDCRDNKLKSLNVSANTKLKKLCCSDNQIAVLNVENNRYLNDLRCERNRLSALNVNNNVLLDFLHLGFNQVTSLDVSRNTRLTFLRCDSNRLSELDASANKNVNQLHCQNNRITHLQVKDELNYSSFVCHDNFLTFSTLPIGYTDGILNSYGYAPQGDMFRILLYTENLDLSEEYRVEYDGETMFTEYKWYDGNNGITSGITNNNGVFTFDKELAGKTIRCEMKNEAFNRLVLKCYVTLLENPNDNYFNEADKEGLRMFLRHEDNFKNVRVAPADTLNWYTDENWVFSLAGLTWTNERLDNRLLGINWMNEAISGEFDASIWLELTHLSLGNNQITKVDISSCPTLKSLKLEDMPLITLNVSNSKAVIDITWKDKELIYLHASNCPNLKTVECQSNQLNVLDVSDCPKLVEMYCYDNRLTTLDVSSCKSLRGLQCHFNQITMLKVNDSEFEYMNCGHNRLLFSTLPLNVSDYIYHPQDTIDGGIVYYHSGIDLRQEFNIAGNITKYEWFDISDGDEQPIELIEINGRFLLEEENIGKRLRCKMTNATFPLLSGEDILVYEVNVQKMEGIESSENIQWNVYPNPTNGILHLQSRIESGMIFKLEKVILFDIFGRQVYETTETVFDISHLPAGVYFVQIKIETDIITQKVVKH